MKRIHLLTGFFLILALAAQGQDKAYYEKFVAEGDRYYNEEQYSLAIQYYTDALQFNVSDPGVDFKLAECYRKTFNYTEAEVYYLKVFYTDQEKFPVSLFYYAFMLKLNGNISEALKRFDQFLVFNGNNHALRNLLEQAVVEKAGCEIGLQEHGFPVSYKADLLTKGINTAYNDFAPAFRDTSTLVITSSRIASNRTLIDERYGEAFTDNYYFQKQGAGWEDKTRHSFAITNSRYNDGSGSFTKNGDRYFFTVCEENCQIFESRFINNKWTTPAPLSKIVNYPNAETKQPSVSAQGDTLYFVSNRPGGYGQFDLWMSFNKGENQWTAAINAGRSVNTKANELSPTITGYSNFLFFASEGHPGYGGYDLYMAKKKSTGDTVVYNLNYPFNSVRDDCFLTFNGKDMLWSSNRDGGYGGFDIYSGKNVSVIGLASRLSLKNRNDSRTATLTSRTARSENVNLLASRNEESIDYNNLTYESKALVNRMIENRLNNIENKPENFSALSQEEFEILNELSHNRFQGMLLTQKYASILLSEVSKTTDIKGALSITGQLIDANTGASVNSSKILLTNEFGEILKITNTNDQGYFRFTGVSADTQLFLRLESILGRSVNAFVKDIRMTGSDQKNSLYVENVYFDFDHYVIRPEAAQVLGQLTDYLKANPGAQVEIYAFADDRGSSAYNFELTQKRGEAVVSFLTNHGVDATSFAIIPKGRQDMKRSSNEIQRQYNRRAEFYINGVRETFTPSVKTYITKKEADWNYIAKLTGISREELQVLNGSDSDAVKAFQPIRLPLNAQSISEELFFVGI